MVHLVLCPGGLPPFPLDLGPARGVGVSLDCRLLRVSTLPLLQFLRELEKGELLDRSGFPLPAPLPRLSLPIPRSTLDDVGNWERLRRTAPACYSLVVPDLRIEEHGRIRELVHGRVVLVTVAVVLALAPLPVRGQEVESVEGSHRRGRGLLTTTALDAYALILGETGLDPRIDTGLAEIDLDVTGLGLLTATDHVVSVRVPQLAGEVTVTRSTTFLP